MNLTDVVCLTPEDKYPFLRNLLIHVLDKSEITVTEITNIMSASHLLLNEPVFRQCEQTLGEIMDINGSTLRELAEVLETFFTYQSLKEMKTFSEVVDNVYEMDFYPVAEHLIYALPYGTERKRVMINFVTQIEGDFENILDAGVGPGVIFSEILKIKQQVQGYAIDVSKKCTDYTKTVLRYFKITDRTHVSVQDMRKTAFKEEFFDIVVASEVIEHVPDPWDVLHEIHRILRRGGYLIIGVPIRLPMTMHLYDFTSIEQTISLFRQSGFDLVEAHLYPLYNEALDLTAKMVKR